MKHSDEAGEPVDRPDGADPTVPDPASAGAEGGALVEPAEEAVARLEARLAELKDRHLPLAAEYDNFRKRTQKERSELGANAQAGVLHRLPDPLDYLASFT